MTESAADAIQQVGYSHDKMIDLIVANPRIKQDDLADWEAGNFAQGGRVDGWSIRAL